jgi:hypothetical protein
MQKQHCFEADFDEQKRSKWGWEMRELVGEHMANHSLRVCVPGLPSSMHLREQTIQTHYNLRFPRCCVVSRHVTSSISPRFSFGLSTGTIGESVLLPKNDCPPVQAPFNSLFSVTSPVERTGDQVVHSEKKWKRERSILFRGVLNDDWNG